MINYNKVSYQLKRKIFNFSKKVSINFSKPMFKFVFQMLFGMMSSSSIHLSNIARHLKEDITLKKTIDRLSLGIKRLDSTKQNQLMINYAAITKQYIDKRTIFCIDHSDIVKPCSKSLENLGTVHDGSTGRNNVKGYNLFEIAALTHKKAMPMPVYTKVFSNYDKSFVSMTDETLIGLKYLSKTYGNIGIKALDRGFDNIKFFKYFTSNKEAFVIRAKSNRNVIHKDKVINILELAYRYKGRYSLLFKNKSGKSFKSKVSFVPIKLPNITTTLYLVVVYGFGKIPMLLITNIPPKDKSITTAIVKVYLKRWRIEEYFKFKKQQFNFEDIRIRSFNGIRALNLLLTILIGFIGMLSDDQDESILVKCIEHEAKRLTKSYKFNYYRIADGIYNIFKNVGTGIYSFIKPISHILSKSQQLILAECLIL